MATDFKKDVSFSELDTSKGADFDKSYHAETKAPVIPKEDIKKDATEGDTKDGDNSEDKPVEPPFSEITCKKCGILCTTRHEWRLHMQTFLHARNILEGKMVEEGKTTETDNFYCDVCDVTASGQLCYDQHMKGAKHIKNLKRKQDGLKAFVKNPYKVKASTKPSKLQPQINACRDPLIGLMYLIEYNKVDPKVEPKYVCNLCESKCDERQVLIHIVGSKHRFGYLKEHHSESVKDLRMNKSMKKSEMSVIITEIAAKIEKLEGRQKVDVRFDNTPFYNPPPAKKRMGEFMQGGPNKMARGGGRGGGVGGRGGAQGAGGRGGFGRGGGTGARGGGGGGGTRSGARGGTRGGFGGARGGARGGGAGRGGYNAGGGQGGNTLWDETDTFKVPAPRGRGGARGGGRGGMGGNLDSLVQKLSAGRLDSEEDAEIALSVSNTLTKALLNYRLNEGGGGGGGSSSFMTSSPNMSSGSSIGRKSLIKSPNSSGFATPEYNSPSTGLNRLSLSGGTGGTRRSLLSNQSFQNDSYNDNSSFSQGGNYSKGGFSAPSGGFSAPSGGYADASGGFGDTSGGFGNGDYGNGNVYSANSSFADDSFDGNGYQGFGKKQYASADQYY